MARPFNVGHLPEAALTILEVLDAFRTSARNLYKVRYDCCSKDGTLMHRSITRRIENGFTLCRDCGQNGSPERLDVARAMKLRAEARLEELDSLRRRKPEADYGFVMPPWSVPSQAVSMYLREREVYNHQC